jgi:hypothetical protein
MRKKIAVIAVAGGIGLTGGMLIAPGIATAADNGSTSVGGRLNAIKGALKGLVSDGTLTQDQADKVATTLDDKLPKRGPGGPGGPGKAGPFGLRGPGPFGGPHVHPEDVAAAVGLTPQQLRTQLESGKTLTQIAAAQGISKAALVDKLVKAAKADIAADVKAGRLTQAQADAISKDLEARIAKKVDRVGAGPRMGHHGPKMGAPDGDDAPSGTPAEPSSLDANA